MLNPSWNKVRQIWVASGTSVFLRLTVFSEALLDRPSRLDLSACDWCPSVLALVWIPEVTREKIDQAAKMYAEHFGDGTSDNPVGG